MATLNFNAAEVEPNAGFEPLPAGRYQAVIINSEMRTTRAGTGSYLWLEFEVIDGDHKGRRLWSNLNLDNPNPEAVRIARSDLSAICHAVNVMTPADSVELHNLPLAVMVSCRQTPDGEMVNEIRGYAPQEQAVPQPAPAPAPAASRTTSSWMQQAKEQPAQERELSAQERIAALRQRMRDR